jgi:integrase
MRKKTKLIYNDQIMPPDIAWAISLMVNCFLRPGDLTKLKHRHVEVIRGKNTYLRLTLPETKLHAAPIVTLRPAVRIYEQICKHQTASSPNDYLLLPHIKNRTYALNVLGTMFNWVLDETGLKLNPHGHPRSLYSLRHSAITFRLLYGQGIDLVTLARNARTSVEVINNHYASTVTGEQNIAMLQSKRGRT